jgi:hypothetical protein
VGKRMMEFLISFDLIRRPVVGSIAIVLARSC